MQAADVEQVIRLIPGVMGTRVGILGDEVREIHALVGPGRHPKQVVRDIESVLAAHLGLLVDRRRISVAQMESESTRCERLSLDAIHLTLKGDVTEVRVELVWNSLRFTGTASGPTSARHKLRSVAAAAAAAAQSALPKSVQLVVEDVARTQVTDAQAIVVVVSALTGGVEDVLVGSAFVRRDESEAAARSVLAALNLHLGPGAGPLHRLDGARA